MSGNWWEAAPLADQPRATAGVGNWWEAAPLVEAPAAPAAPDDRPTMLGSAARGVARGVTFGFADELAGLVGGAANAVGGDGFSAGYARYRDAARRQNELDDRTNPISAVVGQVVGGVATLPLNVVGQAARGAGVLARAGNAALRGATSGAAGGALAGFGEGEGGLENRLGAAATGGAIGGALGGVVGVGANAASGVAGRVLDTLGLRNADRAADRQVLRALERDGIDPNTLLTPPAGHAAGDLALVDRGGANLRNLTAAATNTPGTAQEVGDQFVQARRAARPERVASAVDQSLGGGGGTRYADEVDALRQQRTAQARPLYQAAHAAQAPDTPEIQQIMNLPVVQQAMRENLDLQRMAARGGHFEPSQMQMLDAAKRGLDERIAATIDPVTNRVIPGRGEESIALREVRDALVQQMDAVPEYAAARAAWAGPTQSMEAMQRGRQVLTTDRDVVAQIVQRLSPSDLDFFRLGVGRAVTDATSDPARASGAVRRLFEDRQMQARLEAAIPDPAQRSAFMGALQREVEMTAVERAISPRVGSQTRRLEAGQDDMAIDPPGGMLAALMMGRIGEATRQGMTSLYRRTQGINSSTADALARRLLETDQTRNAETVQRLLRQSNADQMTAEQRGALAAALLQSLGATTSMTVN